MGLRLHSFSDGVYRSNKINIRFYLCVRFFL
jgi:hypothetical protein